MNKINSTQLMSAYEATRQFISEDKSAIEIFHPVKTMFEEKKSRPDASIMVYGVYNAGKSTLINTLLGREEAATDDVPLTDRVTAYQWGQYSIIDTPGVDAPIDHENVTRAQMLKADAVIFVGLTQKKLSEYIEFLLDLVRCSFRNHLVNDHETYST